MRTSPSGRAAPQLTSHTALHGATPPLKPIALAVALALAAPQAALAVPVGHTVVAGDVGVTQPNAQTMVINQSTDKAILNWRAFSIAAAEKVQFVQPGSSSVALNRVTGGAPSEIFGRLEANGKVFLVNPAGVLFGRGASVDVGGLVASTLGVGDADFLAGRYAFEDGGDAGAVSNEGKLVAAERGTIALLGAQVSNDGTVSARLGTVGLAAGGKVTLDFNGDGLTRIVVDAARINALVQHGGAIIAEGGQVTMTARALDSIADTVVRQRGLVQATGLVERDGRILLDGGSGGVEIAGRIDVSGAAPGLSGGAVTLLGHDIALAAGARIDASGDAGGGTVLVGGGYRGADPLLPHAASVTMAPGAAIRADALGEGAGGKVVLWSDGPTSAHGRASATGGARGGSGGVVETSGRTLDVAGVRVDAGAVKGAPGTWLLDPGDIVINTQMASAISSALDNSTSVTVSTRDADSDGPGDIYVQADIEKTAGGDTTLLLEADRDITVSAGVRIASTGTAGALNLDFSADVDALSGGGVALLPGASVLTNGGSVRIYGRDNPASGFASGSAGLRDGVLLQGATIDTRRDQSDAGASGSIAIFGAGRQSADEDGWGSTESVGLRIDNASLLSTSGSITLNGIGGTYTPDYETLTDARGIVIDLAGGARIATGAGALDISATAGRLNSDYAGVPALYARIGFGSGITTGGGAMRFSGFGRSGAGIDMALTEGTLSSGGALSMSAPFAPASAPGAGGIVLSLDESLLAAEGGLSLSGTGGQRAGVELSSYFSTVRGASVSFAGTGSMVGGGINAAIEGGIIEAGSGGVGMTGTGGDNGSGVALSMEATSIRTPGSVSLTGSGGNNASGVDLSMVLSEIVADAGTIAVSGSGGRSGDGTALRMQQAGMSAPAIAISGDAGLGGTGVAGEMIDSSIRALAGPLTIEGTGAGSGAGVRLYMSSAQIGAAQGDARISGGGGDAGGSGVVISSFDGEAGADGSFGAGGVMTGSSALVYADRDLTIAGKTGSGDGGVSEVSGFESAGVDLTGLALRAYGGDLLIGGAGLADGGSSRPGVALTNVLAYATSADGLRTGTLRFLAASTGAGPALVIDGASLGDRLSNGSVIIGARNAGPGPVFSYPGASQWANAVDSTGVITLRPDDGNIDYGGIPASTVPIVVGDSSSGFNASLASFGVGRMSSPSVVIGGVGHTGKITFQEPAGLSGNLTLQNAGAGSDGIALVSDLNVSGVVTLSSGGAVDGSGVAISAAGLLLHGAQPEANFLLNNPNNRVDRFAAWFDQPASTARPEYGDVSFRNSGALRVSALSGAGFDGLAPVLYTVGDSVVAGDLLLRSAGTLTLERNLAARGGNITLVTDAVLDSGGHTLTAGGSWRVFADTWVGENRAGLAPSKPRPNYYNCAYGDLCAAAIAGNRFIYRAQPTLTLTPDALSRAYGASNPALSFTSAGLVNGDTVADALSGGYTSTARQGSNVGAYPTYGAFTSPVGYAIDARAGTLYVDRAALLISVDDKNKVYGAADPVLTATFSGLVLQDNAGVVSGLTLAAPTGSAATAGTHAIVGANAVAANYAISYQPGTLTVAKAPLAVLVDDKAKVYGDADPALSARVSGFQYGDSAAVISGLTLSGATGAAATAGSHAITAAGGSAANYTFSYQPGTLTVARAPLTVLALDQAKVYGDPDPVLTAGFNGLKYGDSGAVVSGLALTAATGAAATAGSHPIVASGGAAANYTLSYQGGTLRVARAPLLVVADNKSKVYGAPDPVLSATMSGFRYADTAAAVSGVVLSAPTGAAAGAGDHPIVAQGGTAANYALSYQPGVLAVEPALLTYVAAPTRRLRDATRAIPGSVTGFVYDDTLASATSGTLQFVSLAPALAPPGIYAVEGRGLTAANYRFVQAASNATALTTLPIALDERPTIARDITFESSNVYEKNFGSPRLCVGVGPLGSGSGGAESNDMLALEWSRVRVSPNLSNCLGLGQRNSCQDF